MNNTREIAVGFFVLLGLVCLSYLTIKLGRMEIIGDTGYQLTARFNSASGLRVGADIELAGVPVGRVALISVDVPRAQAVVTLRLKENIQLPEDTIASIKTSGLIGDKYVNLSPGGSEEMLARGSEIHETESAVDIESLIGKYAFGGV